MLRGIGIDFGTTNTAAAALMDGGEVKLLPLDETARDPSLLKTLLYFPSARESFFGQQAIDSYFDRDMEGRFLQSVKKLLPNPDFQGTTLFGKHASVDDLVSRFLKETLKRIEKQVGSLQGVPIVMGRPAVYSADPEREALGLERFKKACEQAGIAEFTLLEEPIAAALTYQSTRKGSEIILVADLGGGTSDFTLMKLSSGGSEVLAVHGVPLAGDALDSSFMLQKLARFFGSEIRYQRPFSSNILTLPTSFVKLLPKWHQHAFLKERSTWEFLKGLRQELVDPTDRKYLDNLIALVEDNLGYSLHRSVETLKIELSEKPQAKFSFQTYPVDIEIDVPVTDYEILIREITDPIVQVARETLAKGGVASDQVDAVYFTGGTSRVPLLRKSIQAEVPRAVVAEKDTFTSVASGLALSLRRL